VTGLEQPLNPPQPCKNRGVALLQRPRSIVGGEGGGGGGGLSLSQGTVTDSPSFRMPKLGLDPSLLQLQWFWKIIEDRIRANRSEVELG
jgi:hypothetical protein